MLHLKPKFVQENKRWLVSQIGAREHYAVARGLFARGELAALLTDAWVPPGSAWTSLPAGGKLKDRYHYELKSCRVVAATGRGVCWEIAARARRLCGWKKTIARNIWYQQFVRSQLPSLGNIDAFFSYSYTALQLLPFCRDKGWVTVVGQIDPGPVEERIVAEEHARFPDIHSAWSPAPRHYWDDWREEMDLTDRIVVNSLWSRKCLLEEGIDEHKITVIPLVYQKSLALQPAPIETVNHDRTKRDKATFDVLFLGQVNLRKGIARLIEAMRLLQTEQDVRLLLAGPSEVSPTLWQKMANVKYLGPVRRSRVTELYQSADVFILPSLSDGYAITQLEALAHGLPVIASRQCGDCVIEGHNGWRLKDVEPSTIAEAILKAKREDLRFDQPTTFGVDSFARKLVDFA